MSAVIERTACPICQSEGKDTAGDNLTRFESGAYACVANAEHTGMVVKLRPDLVSGQTPLKSKRPISHPRASIKKIDLLSRIKSDYPASLGDLWESSPVKCDGKIYDSESFLKLFPADAVLWIAPDNCEAS